VLHKDDAFLGQLLMFQMLGSVVGNLMGGVLGDRNGGRGVMLLSLAGSALVAAASPVLGSALGFKLEFLALGWAIGLGSVGVATLDLEMSGFAQRMSYQTVIGLSHLVGLLGAVAISAFVRQLSSSFAVLAWISVCLLLGSLLLLSRLPEPRHAPLDTAPRSGPAAR
jgi:MFS family permease